MKTKRKQTENILKRKNNLTEKIIPNEKIKRKEKIIDTKNYLLKIVIETKLTEKKIKTVMKTISDLQFQGVKILGVIGKRVDLTAASKTREA